MFKDFITNWQLNIHGWIYEPEWGGSISQSMRHLFDIEETEQLKLNSLFIERAKTFFVDNERGKQISINLDNELITLKNKSARNGHFFDSLILPAKQIEILRTGYVINFKAVTRPDDKRDFIGKIHLIDNKGVSIISDIDDTVKISEVLDKQALLKNTFINPFKPVLGMAEFYNNFGKNITFHYVSASPWQLYQPLTNFLTENNFPNGSFHLRLFRWKDSSLFKFIQSSQNHKNKSIKALLKCCPQRRFILIGDSGEHDPKIYANIARQYPQQILHIFIREVTNNIDYKEIFHGLSKWTVFKNTQELKTSLQDLIN
ncbi:App1 family protein [Candidatus Halobeggiatoa sp. HSG11]|nr:App1 family protein [Candidatus Halobeggiatoa sp. HSG11]